MGTVPAGLADIYDLCETFVCFDDLRLPWGQSPQVLENKQVFQCAAKMAGFLPAAARRDASPHHAVMRDV